MKLLDAVREVRTNQVEDSLWAIGVLQKGKDVVTERYNFYNNKGLMNEWEATHMAMEGAAMVLSLIDTGTQPVTGALHLIPDAKLGAPTSIGFTIGGTNIGKSSSKFAKFVEKSTVLLSRGSTMAATMGSYWRRKDDWDLQFRLADAELKQLESQIQSATVRNAMAQKELDNHDIQIKDAKDTDEFLKSKYTAVELYDWMLSQLSTTYFQIYQLVFETAKRAERAFAFELGVKQADFIFFDYWDSMQKGLTAGDRLFCDLKRMDMAYLDQDLREYEVSRSISLAQLDPVALIQLRQSGPASSRFPRPFSTSTSQATTCGASRQSA
jgi:Tc toxin complex TcA C-terminal TcB-binding domain